MAEAIQEYSKFEFCAVARFLQAAGVSQSEIHHKIMSVYVLRQ
jgi:hypothetical protein